MEKDLERLLLLESLYYKNNEILCPDGMDAEDFYEEELKERLSECSIVDSKSGRKRKLSHIEVNAVSTFIKTL